METIDSQDVYGVVEEEQEFTKKLSQTQRPVFFKKAELEMQTRLRQKKKGEKRR